MSQSRKSREKQPDVFGCAWIQREESKGKPDHKTQALSAYNLVRITQLYDPAPLTLYCELCFGNCTQKHKAGQDTGQGSLTHYLP